MSFFRVGDMVQDETGESMAIIGGPIRCQNGKVHYTVFRNSTSCSTTRVQEQLTRVDKNIESKEYDEAASIATTLRMFNSGASLDSIWANMSRELEKIKQPQKK